MRRDTAIKAIYNIFPADTLFIFANGRNNREGYVTEDRVGNFYMLSSMGKAASIGLGVALARQKRKVAVVDGDGNALMNLDNFAMIGYCKPENLTHIVLDNKEHATTGGQSSHTTKIDLSEVARACGYKAVSVKDEKGLERALTNCRDGGPYFVLAHISKERYEVARTPHRPPEEIRDRFMKAARR